MVLVDVLERPAAELVVQDAGSDGSDRVQGLEEDARPQPFVGAQSLCDQQEGRWIYPVSKRSKPS